MCRSRTSSLVRKREFSEQASSYRESSHEIPLKQTLLIRSYPSIPNVPRAAPSHTWDPITRPSPRSLSQEAIERSQNQGRRSDGDDEDAAPHAAHDKAVNVERLGFFKRADGKREEGKDQEDGWGQRKGTVRDEL
jgi:hypothetical protein